MKEIEYPYMIVRMISAVYQKEQLPMNKDREELLLYARKVSRQKNLKCCLVFAEDDCVYFDPDGTYKKVESPPQGGLNI